MFSHCSWPEHQFFSGVLTSPEVGKIFQQSLKQGQICICCLNQETVYYKTFCVLLAGTCCFYAFSQPHSAVLLLSERRIAKWLNSVRRFGGRAGGERSANKNHQNHRRHRRKEVCDRSSQSISNFWSNLNCAISLTPEDLKWSYDSENIMVSF